MHHISIIKEFLNILLPRICEEWSKTIFQPLKSMVHWCCHLGSCISQNPIFWPRKEIHVAQASQTVPLSRGYLPSTISYDPNAYQDIYCIVDTSLGEGSDFLFQWRHWFHMLNSEVWNGIVSFTLRDWRQSTPKIVQNLLCLLVMFLVCFQCIVRSCICQGWKVIWNHLNWEAVFQFLAKENWSNFLATL